MTKVKICGNTNEHDAFRAAELGADFLGFIVDVDFSEDSVTKEEAKKLMKRIPLETRPVLVTYLDKASKIIQLAKDVKPEIIQLHNPKVDLKTIGKVRKALPKLKIIKTIHVSDESAIEEAKKYEDYVDYLLLDTKTKTKLGGTGVVHDWEISRKIVKSVKCKVFLAGGLNQTNVSIAIGKVKPFAVDTNSGVKSKPRKKDKLKLEKFIHRAKK
jgi:phosphoribosylanthranilate isomerase